MVGLSKTWRGLRVNRFRAIQCSVVCVLWCGALVCGDEPKPTEPKPISAPAIQSAEKRFAEEIARADEAYKKARRVAAESRLKVHRDRLAELTKKGDFDGATALKARITELETVHADAVRPRPKDVVRFDGHSYALIKEPATWHVAKRRCEEMGGHLVTFESPKEAAFVARLCADGDADAWIGASDEEEEGRIRWITGAEMNLKIQADNANGHEHHIQWLARIADWNDNPAGMRCRFVCEWD